MAQIETTNITSRRGFLSFLGLAGATTAATAAVAATTLATPEIEESKAHFETPLEYLTAMQSIGWSAVAMFHRFDGGNIICMGVNENGPGEEGTMKTWCKHHAISMRCPAQLPMDIHPNQGWWKEVWQFLYDRGLRENVTPVPKVAQSENPSHFLAGG